MLLWLMACKSAAVVLEFDPDPLDFGEVIFGPDMPDNGYAQEELSVINAGEKDVTLSLAPYDTQWFCIEGFPEADAESPLSTLSPGANYLLEVGICDHEPGTFDSDVELALGILSDGEPSRVNATITLHPVLQTAP